MIIQVRGTSGSGKTTVMREVMAVLEVRKPWFPIHQEGRRKPLYYQRDGVAVLGHYEESACGGCDTIGSARQVYDLIQEIKDLYPIILCEGLLLSEDTKWTLRMEDPRVFFLSTSLDLCLQRIKGRRAAVGNEKPLNPRNTENRVATIERARIKLLAAGVYCRRCSSIQATSLITDLIRLHADRRS